MTDISFTAVDVDAAVGQLVANRYLGEGRPLGRDDPVEIVRIVLSSAATGGRLLPDSNLVWIVDTEAAHDQPFGVFTDEQAAKDAAAKTPGTSWSSIFLNRIYT